MAMPGLSHEDLQKLKVFIDFVSANPQILNMVQLDFVKKFIEKFGGKVPSGDFEMPGGGKCPFGGDGTGVKSESSAPQVDSEPDSEPEPTLESEPESEVELDMSGVIKGDTDVDQPMGDASKTPTEEEIDEASELRSKASASYSEKKFNEAIELYTKAIELNPGNALFHAKRGQAFLKLEKPNACIRDCEKALELNCDSAAAYKFRGRAHRLLGNWELAAKDLRQACKLDFDEETDEWLREVTPNAKKIEQHLIKQERRQIERTRKAQEAARRKTQKPKFRSSFNRGEESTSKPSGDFGFGDILSGLQDPEMMAALEDIAKNPANIEKYKSNPKIINLVDMVKKMSGGGGGFPGGMPGGMPDLFPGVFSPGEGNAAGAGTGAGAAAAGGATETEPKPQPKKPDFVDDGLD